MSSDRRRGGQRIRRSGRSHGGRSHRGRSHRGLERGARRRRRPAVPRRAAAPGPAMESRPPRQLEEPRLAIDLLQGRPSRAAVQAQSVPAGRSVLEPPGDPRRGPACRRQRAVQRHWLAADSRATQGRRRPERTHGPQDRWTMQILEPRRSAQPAVPAASPLARAAE